jgi:hypothetical protein
MGRKSILLVCLVLCAGVLQSVRSQGITIDTNDVKIVFANGNTIPQHTDTLTRSADIGAPGATSWNFSALHSTSLKNLLSVPPASTPYAANFPGATIALYDAAFSISFYSAQLSSDIIVKGTGCAYYTLQGALLNAGFKGSGNAYIFGNPYPAQGQWINTPASVEYSFPLRLGTTWTSSYTESISGSGTILGSPFYFGPSFSTHSITYLVDAYGPLTLPGGVVREALRIRKSDNYVNGTFTGLRVSYIIRSRSGASVQLTVNDPLALSGTVGVSDVQWSEGNMDFPVPIVLSKFTAMQREGGSVVLEWTTVSETNNFGFYVQRKRAEDAAFVDVAGAFVAGHGTTIVPQDYSITDMPADGGVWWYRLKQVDLDGVAQYSEPIRTEGTTGVGRSAPISFMLNQNYPNPFNPSTTIGYALPVRSHVVLSVYNALGQEVAILQNGDQEAGYHEQVFDARGLPSGIYWYRMSAGSFVETRRLVLVR